MMPITITERMNAPHTTVPIADKASTKVILIKIEGLRMFCKMIVAIFIHSITFAPRRFWR
jgi:hypothetical protein